MSEDMRLFEPVCPGRRELEEFFSSRGLRCGDVFELGGGLINSNYRVETDEGPVLLRIYDRERPVEEIVFELSVLSWLDEQGLRVQAPRFGVDPDLIADSPCAVLRFIDGETLEPKDLDPGISEQAGRLVAELQKALGSFRPAGSKPRCDVPEIYSLLLDSLREVPALDAENMKAVWHIASEAFDVNKSRHGVVHADIHPGNVVSLNGELRAIIDFDDAYFGDQAMDVAIAAMEFSCGDSTDFDPLLLGAFVRGYQAASGLELSPEHLVRGMWVNCFRFFAYTLPLTLRAGATCWDNVYARRIKMLRSDSFRRDLMAAMSCG